MRPLRFAASSLCVGFVVAALWDHDAPTVAVGMGANGDDVLYTQTVSTPSLELSRSTRFAGTCPAGRVAGP